MSWGGQVSAGGDANGNDFLGEWARAMPAVHDGTVVPTVAPGHA